MTYYTIDQWAARAQAAEERLLRAVEALKRVKNVAAERLDIPDRAARATVDHMVRHALLELEASPPTYARAPEASVCLKRTNDHSSKQEGLDMDSNTLQDLLARVEKATEMTWALFMEVCNATYPPMATNDDVEAKMRLADFIGAQAWTDAALALVERVLPDLPWAVQTAPGKLFYGRIYDRRSLNAYLPTPALAILAALLKALIAQAASPAHASDQERLRNTETNAEPSK